MIKDTRSSVFLHRLLIVLPGTAQLLLSSLKVSVSHFAVKLTFPRVLYWDLATKSAADLNHLELP